MPWWRNNDSRDDINEANIKLIFLGALLIGVIYVISLFFFTGCSAKVTKPWDCECNCGNNKLKCNGITLDNKIQGY